MLPVGYLNSLYTNSNPSQPLTQQAQNPFAQPTSTGPTGYTTATGATPAIDYAKPPGSPGAQPPGSPAAQPAMTPGAASPAPPNPAYPGSYGGGQTFAQMQQAGMARPAPPPIGANPFTPQPPPNAAMTPTGGSPAPAAGSAPMGGTAPAPSGGTPTGTQPSGAPATTTGGTKAPGGQGPNDTNPSIPGNNTSTNTATDPVNQQLIDSIMALMQQPSGYDDAQFQKDVALQEGNIDDQYNLARKQTANALQERGLGTADDSTIGLGYMSDLNIGQRSAKAQMDASLDSQRAQQLSANRQQAINEGLGLEQLYFNKDALTQSGLQYLLQMLNEFGIGIGQNNTGGNSVAPGTGSPPGGGAPTSPNGPTFVPTDGGGTGMPAPQNALSKYTGPMMNLFGYRNYDPNGYAVA